MKSEMTIEEKLLEQYGGRGNNSLPQTLMVVLLILML
jgi:hypothetical protein